MKTIFDELLIRSIEGGVIVNNANQRYHAYEIEGLDSYFRSFNFEAAETFFNRELGTIDATIELFSLSVLSDPENEANLKAGDFLKRTRAQYLKEKKLKSNRKYLVITSDKAGKSLTNSPLREDVHRNFLDIFGLKGRLLDTHEIKELYYRLLNIDDAFSTCADMTLKEQLVQTQMRYTEDHLRIGGQYVKVITLKHLPDQLYYFDIDRVLDDFAFEHCFVSSSTVLDQRTAGGALTLMRNVSYSSVNNTDAAGNVVNKPTNHAAMQKFEESDQLKSYLEETGHLFVSSTQKLIVWHTDPAQLEEIARAAINAFKRRNIYMHEEEYYHDKEFFRSLPGTTFYSARGNKVLTPHALALLPLSRLSGGDKNQEFPLYLRTRFGTLFAFDSFSQLRQPWNTMVLGASGSGKSVTMNMIIISSIYPRIQKYGGKCFIIDFAGAENSSYTKLVMLFGGKFIAIDSTAKYTVNPFPRRSLVLRDGEFDAAQLTFLQIVLDLVIGNSGEDANSNLKRFIIAKAIQAMYRENEKPRLEHLIPYIEQVDSEDTHLKREIVKLLAGFLSTPESKLLNSETNIDYADAPFVVFDLQGVSGLTERLRQLMTMIVINEAKIAAYRTKGWKSILLDEAAQLIKDPRMISLIDEMYSTARKYNAQVYTITQNYLSYKECNLSSKIKLNTTATFILSHADAPEAKRLVAEDFGFSDYEKKEFEGLKTIKRQYALAIVKMQVGDRIETATVRIELSPFEYWLATSDKSDNEKLEKIAKERGCTIVEACWYAAQEAK